MTASESAPKSIPWPSPWKNQSERLDYVAGFKIDPHFGLYRRDYSDAVYPFVPLYSAIILLYSRKSPPLSLFTDFGVCWKGSSLLCDEPQHRAKSMGAPTLMTLGVKIRSNIYGNDPHITGVKITREWTQKKCSAWFLRQIFQAFSSNKIFGAEGFERTQFCLLLYSFKR